MLIACARGISFSSLQGPTHCIISNILCNILLSFSANKMWCLGLHLPFLIGDFVENDDDYSPLLCTLLQTLQIIFSPVVSKQVAYLQILIQKLVENFKELFPESSIIPKMLYMIHMPRTMLE